MTKEWTEKQSLDMGKRIAEARESRGWSLAYVADRLGVSKGTVGHWETGIRAIKAGDLARLCNLLQISADQALFGRTMWPFQSIELEAVQQLEPEEIQQIEGAIKLVSAQMGVELSKPAATPDVLGGGSAGTERSRAGGKLAA